MMEGFSLREIHERRTSRLNEIDYWLQQIRRSLSYSGPLTEDQTRRLGFIQREAQSILKRQKELTEEKTDA